MFKIDRTPKLGRTIKAVGIAVGIALTASPSWSHAQGGFTGGTAHVNTGTTNAITSRATSISPSLAARSTASTSRTTSPASGVASTISPIAPTTPVPSFATQCEGEVSANCEARAESLYDATGGDLATPWSAPVPTVVPATPTAPAITEPAPDTQNFEQSDGGSGVVITAGGGPTLTDCMALWEPAVHMTKALWRDVCQRTMNGINEPTLALRSVDPSYGAASAAHKGRSETSSR